MSVQSLKIPIPTEKNQTMAQW